MKFVFPVGFRWGISTAAAQIEGAWKKDGRQPSIWDTFSRIKGMIQNGDRPDIACDHYHRYKEDIALMAKLGISDYRFSISWSRVISYDNKGRPSINPKGLAFYDRLIDEVLDKGITPWICLYHWDLPQALQNMGGWQNRRIAEHFEHYSAVIAERFGDRVKHFVTFNEQNVSMLFGHMTGEHAPGIRNVGAAAAASHHSNLAHGRAVHTIREMVPDAKIGVIHNVQPVYPAEKIMSWAAERTDNIWNRTFADPQILGSYPDETYPFIFPFIAPGDMEIIKQPVDFFGVNYYAPFYMSHERGTPDRFFIADPPLNVPMTDMGWEIRPAAFHDILMRLTNRYPGLPLYITENGAGYEEEPGPDEVIHDSRRIAYLHGHLAAVHRAIQDGADIRGYFIWSMLDNYEWAEGYKKRFGIVNVNYDTLKRAPKDSYYEYQKIILANSLKIDPRPKPQHRNGNNNGGPKLIL